MFKNYFRFFGYFFFFLWCISLVFRRFQKLESLRVFFSFSTKFTFFFLLEDLKIVIFNFRAFFRFWEIHIFVFSDVSFRYFCSFQIIQNYDFFLCVSLVVVLRYFFIILVVYFFFWWCFYFFIGFLGIFWFI